MVQRLHSEMVGKFPASLCKFLLPGLLCFYGVLLQIYLSWVVLRMAMIYHCVWFLGLFHKCSLFYGFMICVGLWLLCPLLLSSCGAGGVSRRITGIGVVICPVLGCPGSYWYCSVSRFAWWYYIRWHEALRMAKNVQLQVTQIYYHK